MRESMFKLTAHRSGCLKYPENSLEGLIYAADAGMDLVECDVAELMDGTLVIFHDDNILRMAGIDKSLKKLTHEEMRLHLSARGKALLTLDGLFESYDRTTPVLLHIKEKVIGNALLNKLKNSKVDFVLGVVSEEAAALLSNYFSKEKILAFMPDKNDYPRMIKAGAGIIRLWENWLSEITPDKIKEYADVKVWIMSCGENRSARGSEKSLDRFLKMNADGALLDDTELALNWKYRI